MALCNRIKEARLKRELTQEQLANLVGVAKSTITGYEKGNRIPTAAMVGQIADVTGVDANFLFQDEVTELYKDKATPEEFENIIKKYRDLDNHGKETVSYILDRELKRTQQLEKAAAEMQRSNIRIIQYYQKLASAGTGQVLFDDVAVDRIEIPDVPEYKRVSYAIGVNGKSMEPLYQDGDVLLIEPTCQIEIGEIGIFIVGNEAFVKKLGEEELISLNKGHVNVPLTEDSKCMGRVVDKLTI